MNWKQIQDKWHDYKGQIQQRWAKLTDDDITIINGRREVLAGKILERSGVRNQIEQEIAAFEAECIAATPAAGTP